MNPFLAVVARKKAVVGGGGGGGGAFKRTLTVDHLLVPGTQTNFPALVSLTDTTLKTVANSGHVARSDGFDIGFYSDSGLTTKLKWEMESYSGTTGTVVAWVKIPSLSAVSDTTFYMGYGDSAITTDQSDPANVWSNGFISVYHLGNGTTLSVADSIAANNGTNTNGVTATTGKIDGCGSFASASNQYINLGTGINPTAITYNAWVKATSFPNATHSVVVREDATGATMFDYFVNSSGKIELFTRGADSGDYHYSGSGSHTLSTGVWYYLSAVWDSAGGFTGVYVNTTLDGSVGFTPGTLLKTSPTPTTWIGNHVTVPTLRWNGLIDEVQISSVTRSVNWITAAYNNQNSPGTFMTLGTEV